MRKIKNKTKSFKLLYNRLPILLTLMLIIGVISGAFLSICISKSELKELSGILISFVEKRNKQQLYNTFISALIPNIISWTVAFICGFCAVATPITALIPLIRSMGYGLTASLLIINYNYKGIKYIIAHLLINYILSAIALVFCCCESIRMSKYFWQAMYSPQKATNNDLKPAVFCGKMLIYGIIIVGGSMIEAYSYIS